MSLNSSVCSCMFKKAICSVTSSTLQSERVTSTNLDSCVSKEIALSNNLGVNP